MTKRIHERGFSLTELMVALVVMAIVTTQLLLSYSNQHRNAIEQEFVVESQEEARLLTDLALSDLRLAGFMVPREAGVGSIDGGNAAADLLCMSDPAAVDAAVLPGATSRFDGANTQAALGGNASSVSLSVGSMDIDADGDVDFVVDGGLLISADGLVHCAVIDAVAGGAVSFSPPTPAGFAAPAGGATVVPALVYQVNGTRLTRNRTVLSDQVEDLQVEFGVDIDNNGVVENAEFPIHDLNGQDLLLVRSARVHVTTRTLNGEPDFSGDFAAVANRAAGAADNFKRRRVSADALLRNLR